MAGAGFKDFAVGEVLTASDVDTYLMQQSVMRFADSAARGSALGTATGAGTALAEGMVSYLDDLNAVQVYDGSGWTSPIRGIGANVVQTVKTDAFSASVGLGAITAITGLDVTITPSSATSKILLIVQVSAGMGANNQGSHYLVKRGSTEIGIADAAGSRQRASAATGGGDVTNNDFARSQNTAVINLLDSPATTSATTYSVFVGHTRDTALGSTVYVNRAETDNDASNTARTVSSITAIEVAA